MRAFALLLAVGLVAGLQAAPAAALPGEEFDMPEECVFEDGELGRYIVVFHDWVEDPEAVARDQVERYGGNLGFVYKHALKGYSAEYLPASAEAIQAEPTVEYVEVDQLMWMDDSSGLVQWHSCPAAPPLGPAPPAGPEEPEGPESPEEPEGYEEPEGAEESASPEWPEIPGVANSSQSRAAVPCRRAKASRGMRCAPRGNRLMRICNQRVVAGKRRC